MKFFFKTVHRALLSITVIVALLMAVSEPFLNPEHPAWHITLHVAIAVFFYLQLVQVDDERW